MDQSSWQEQDPNELPTISFWLSFEDQGLGELTLPNKSDQTKCKFTTFIQHSSLIHYHTVY